ncbi:MAG: hypothetical protein ACRDSR_07945 [Pseudonocardiaceae bacterium]
MTVGPVPDCLDLTGWQSMGLGDDPDDVDDAAFTGPDDALFDTSGCPVTSGCAGCGSPTGLHAVTSAFSRPGGFSVACDGRSFLHLLGPAALTEAVVQHAGHQASPG